MGLDTQQGIIVIRQAVLASINKFTIVYHILLVFSEWLLMQKRGNHRQKSQHDHPYWLLLLNKNIKRLVKYPNHNATSESD